ncbi:MAG: CRISPR-associated protein Csx20 [Thermodesulfobacteriota bacterium]|nr:CRISPR-associated protein Csx20 [Thermodesulfobacteriota bacterium]
MPDLFLLFSHSITLAQEEQARQDLGVEQIVSPPDSIRLLWAALPPDLPALQPCLEPVISWLDSDSREGDYVLIHGDFGACYLLVQHCLDTNRVPIYSTTERQAVETNLDDGTIRLTHTFCHVRYRAYGK